MLFWKSDTPLGFRRFWEVSMEETNENNVLRMTWFRFKCRSNGQILWSLKWRFSVTSTEWNIWIWQLILLLDEILGGWYGKDKRRRLLYLDSDEQILSFPKWRLSVTSNGCKSWQLIVKPVSYYSDSNEQILGVYLLKYNSFILVLSSVLCYDKK